ncbi:ribosome-associated GTPase EngA, partial [Chlamydia psittaci 06-1683]
QINLFKK